MREGRQSRAATFPQTKQQGKEGCVPPTLILIQQRKVCWAWVLMLGGFKCFNAVQSMPWEPTFPSFLGVITHISRDENLHFSWFWGLRVCTL